MDGGGFSGGLDAVAAPVAAAAGPAPLVGDFDAVAAVAPVHGVPPGRGFLLLVPADKWGVTERESGEAVWSECAVPVD